MFVTKTTRDWWCWELAIRAAKEANCAAITQAKSILEMRDNSPRLFRNALAFLTIDQSRLQDLDDAVRRYLAWDSIVAEKETLDLAPHTK